MVGFAGLLLALAMGGWAFRRSRAATASYYESDVYDMGPGAHRRWALVALGFALLFAISIAMHHQYDTMLAAGFAVLLVLYAASFLRGYTAEDE